MGKPWIDISEFNTITDWSKVKKNVDCVIIRMGLRGSRDGKIRFDKKYKITKSRTAFIFSRQQLRTRTQSKKQSGLQSN